MIIQGTNNEKEFELAKISTKQMVRAMKPLFPSDDYVLQLPDDIYSRTDGHITNKKLNQEIEIEIKNRNCKSTDFEKTFLHSDKVEYLVEYQNNHPDETVVFLATFEDCYYVFNLKKFNILDCEQTKTWADYCTAEPEKGKHFKKNYLISLNLGKRFDWK